MKISFSLALLVIINIIVFLIDDTTQFKNVLLIIMYDGFRNDYLDRGITPTLNNFRHNGVHSKYLYTVYPALGYPSMLSIATGLYPQNHGIKLRNYTPSTGENGIDGKLEGAYNKNYSLPIWALNEKYGGRSACICWPGKKFTFNGSTCTDKLEYARTTTLKVRADKMIEFLNRTNVKEVPNVVMFYVEELDRITHFFGPLSRNSSLMIRRLDLLTKYIITRLMEIGAYHTTNIFILSDHGMRGLLNIGSNVITDKDKKKYNSTFKAPPDLYEDVNGIVFVVIKGDIKIINYTTATEEFTKLGKNENLFTVVRVPPGVNNTVGNEVEYAACPGYVFSLEKWKADKFDTYATIYKDPTLKPPSKTTKGPYGIHGYLRENDAMFMAKGPNIAKHKTIEPFEMVDLYSAFTKILKIQGDFENDGNFSRVLPMFVQRNPINWTVILVTIAGLAVIFSLIFCGLIEYLLNTVVEPILLDEPTEEPPNESIPSATVPPATVSTETVPSESVPRATVTFPNETVSTDTVRTETAPEDTVSKETAPKETAPKESDPMESAPKDSAPKDSAPKDSAPMESAPMESAPKDSAPKDSAPKETTPNETAAKETAPSETNASQM